MPTFLQNGAEGGVLGASVTSGAPSGGASGNPFDAVNIGALSSITYDNTHAAHGSQSFLVITGNPSANSIIEWTSSLTGGTLGQVWFRVYVYQTSYSSTQMRVVKAVSSGTLRATVAIDSTGHIALINSLNSTVKTSTSVMPLNQWNRIEGFFIGDPAVGQIECKMFTSSPDNVTPDETVTSLASVNTGGTINRTDFGNPASAVSYTFWMDDIAVSDTAYPGPAVYAAQLSGAGTVLTQAVLRNTAEGGTNGTTVTAGNSGGLSGNAWDSVSIGAQAALTYDNSQGGHGSMAYKVASGATTTTALGQWIASEGALLTVWFRTYCYIPSTPTPAWRPFTARSGGNHAASVLFTGTAIQISAGTAFAVPAGATFTTHPPIGSWFRIEGFFTGDAAAGAVSMSVYLSPESATPDETKTVSAINTTGLLSQYWFGNSNSAVNCGPFWFDDPAISPYGPLGPSGVVGAATLAGAGVVGPPAATIQPGAQLIGAGVVSTVSRIQPAPLSLAGAGAVSASGIIVTRGAASLAGAGQVLAVGGDPRTLTARIRMMNELSARIKVTNS